MEPQMGMNRRSSLHKDLGQLSTILEAFAQNLSSQISGDHLLYGRDIPCLLLVASQDGLRKAKDIAQPMAMSFFAWPLGRVEAWR